MNQKKLKSNQRSLVICLSVFLLILSCSASWSASLRFATEKDSAPGKVQLIVDQVEKLAGLKITIHYDHKLLFFEKAEKSAATSPFLHVVNDKTPGKVIIVMASAKGISGKQVPLLHLTLARREATPASPAKISVSQVQLMDENLKEIVADKPEFVIPLSGPEKST